MKKLTVTIICIAMFLVPANTVSAKKYKLLCPDMAKITNTIAKEIGQKKRIDYIMWRESRCNTKAINEDDPYGGSLGLFQINQYWCKRSKSTGEGFLKVRDIVDKCTDLYNPKVQAEAFLEIYTYVDERWDNGWIPWGSPWN
jgi:hypothetical protein